MNNNNNCTYIGELVQSIALEEAGIAHILNAEGEKIQKALEGDISFDQIICLNHSVSGVIQDVTQLEIALTNKLKQAMQNHCCCRDRFCLTVEITVCNSATPLVALVTIFNSNNVIVAQGNTNSDGLFRKCDLPHDTYVVRAEYNNLQESVSFCPEHCCKEQLVRLCFEDVNSSLGNFVWHDVNNNGINEPGEQGVNGVTVQLYDNMGNLLQTTVTNNNIGGEAGYYMFSGLSSGEYRVKFVAPQNYNLTIKRADLPNGSKPDPNTGFTDVVPIGVVETRLDIDAGLVNSTPPVTTVCVRGIVVDVCNRPIINATVYIKGVTTKVVNTDCRGRFYGCVEFVDKVQVKACCYNRCSPTQTFYNVSHDISTRITIR